MTLDDLRRLLEGRTPAGTMEPIEGVYLSREIRPGVPETATTGTVFALIVQGVKQLRLGDQTIEYGPGEYLVTSIDLPVIGRFIEADERTPALGFGMVLTPAAIAELLASSGIVRSSPGRSRGSAAVPALATSRAPEELLAAVGRLVRLLDRPRDLAVLGPMVRREILWWLISGPQGETVRQLGLPGGRIADLSAVVRWIRDHAADPIRIEDLAGRAGLSVSAFHRSFRTITGSSPLQFQKQLRLATARQLLAAREGSVSQVAYAVGYESAAQFNREYRRLFGAPPGRDRDRMAR